AVRGDLEAIETELMHVVSARRQIGNIPSFGRTPLTTANEAFTLRLPNSVSDLHANASGLAVLAETARMPVQAPPTKSNPRTIKSIVLRALWDGFRETGATQAQLRQFIHDAYGRELDRTSLSPQISRLNALELIKQKGGEDNWHL